jgi:FkbM family methyltransferase
MSVKRMIRNAIRMAGWDFRRYDPRLSEEGQLASQLSAHRVEVVFDVGANIGQFAERLRDAGFHGRIISFEPSRAAHSKLMKRAKNDSHWIVAPRMALGNHDGTMTLNLAGNSASSSLLPMLDSHATAAPESRYVGSETVDLRTLDDVSASFLTAEERIFLKLDVQGFEFNVLQGATRFLGGVIGIQLELSLLPLYDGEHLFHPMLDALEQRGFELWSLIPGLVDPRTSRLLQVDAVFFRDPPNRVKLSDDRSGRPS